MTVNGLTFINVDFTALFFCGIFALCRLIDYNVGLH